jgi:hypothetical protein
MYHLFNVQDAATRARGEFRPRERLHFEARGVEFLGPGAGNAWRLVLVEQRTMKRLVILSAVALSAGAAGCKHCGVCGGGAPTAVYRPACPAPACTGAPSFSSPAYSAPGAYTVPDATSTPALTVPPATTPGQTFPGPEVYTPAN